MTGPVAPPLSLVLGREVAEHEQGVVSLSDWAFDEHGGSWFLRVTLEADVAPESNMPAVTVWYIHAYSAYPWGNITVRPALEGGIDKTYPHQFYNGILEGRLYRDGNICTQETGFIPRRTLLSSPEPFASAERLAWHVRRLQRWVEAASRGDLARSGEPFELPDFGSATRTLKGEVVVWSEGPDTLARWQDVPKRGLAEFAMLRTAESGVLVPRLYSRIGGEVITKLDWGRGLQARMEKADLVQGAWLLLDDVPVLPPYQAPMTWEELRACVDEAGLDESLRLIARHLRPGSAHVLLLGFPIPRRIGEAAYQIHWQPICLPGVKAVPKLRHLQPTAQRDLQGQRAYNTWFANDKQINWMATENWNAEALTLRGRLEGAAERRIVLIGAGALGSAIGDLLIRCGCLDVVIFDPQRLEGGNLSRHVLGLDAVGEIKADALAARLSEISIHANVQAGKGAFTADSTEAVDAIMKANVVIDCTGNDHVLAALERIEATEEHLFISLSLGFEARRLLAFASRGPSFPASSFRKWAAPYVEEAKVDLAAAELPVGIGCWHPLFPARWDHVLTLAACSVEALEAWMAVPPPAPIGLVLERKEGIVTANSTEVVKRVAA